MTIDYRNASGVSRAVAYGVAGGRPCWVDPDGILTVEDDAARSYDCQPAIWARVTPARDTGDDPDPPVARAEIARRRNNKPAVPEPVETPDLEGTN